VPSLLVFGIIPRFPILSTDLPEQKERMRILTAAQAEYNMSRAARSELRLFELTKYLIICHILSTAGFWSFRPLLIKFGPVGPPDQIKVQLIKYYFQDRCPDGHGRTLQGVAHLHQMFDSALLHLIVSWE
jgi:hypothetical protein